MNYSILARGAPNSFDKAIHCTVGREEQQKKKTKRAPICLCAQTRYSTNILSNRSRYDGMPAAWMAIYERESEHKYKTPHTHHSDGARTQIYAHIHEQWAQQTHTNTLTVSRIRPNIEKYTFFFLLDIQMAAERSHQFGSSSHCACLIWCSFVFLLSRLFIIRARKLCSLLSLPFDKRMKRRKKNDAHTTEIRDQPRL